MQLDHLVGKKIVDINICHDYLQMNIENLYGINIYNNYNLNGKKASDFKGKIIVGIRRTQDSLIFSFSDSLKITMGLSDEDFNGPEAMENRGPSGAIIVWN